jgi:hypothetical protein
LVVNGLCIFGVPVSSQDFAIHFLDEILFYDVRSSFFGSYLAGFGHFVLTYSSLTLLFHTDNSSFFFLLVYFGGFHHDSYVGMWGHYGSKIVGVFTRPHSKMLNSTIDLFWYIGLSLWRIVPHLFFSKVWFW